MTSSCSVFAEAGALKGVHGAQYHFWQTPQIVAGLDTEKALQHRAHDVWSLGWAKNSSAVPEKKKSHQEERRKKKKDLLTDCSPPVPVCSTRRRLEARSLTGFDFGGGFKKDQNEDFGAAGGGLDCRFSASLGITRAGSCLVGGCGCGNWGGCSCVAWVSCCC